jgi:hypothetical protein
VHHKVKSVYHVSNVSSTQRDTERKQGMRKCLKPEGEGSSSSLLPLFGFFGRTNALQHILLSILLFVRRFFCVCVCVHVM